MSNGDTQPIRAFPSYKELAAYMQAESKRNTAQQWERRGEVGRLLALETARVWNKAGLLLEKTMKAQEIPTTTTHVYTPSCDYISPESPMTLTDGLSLQ